MASRTLSAESITLAPSTPVQTPYGSEQTRLKREPDVEHFAISSSLVPEEPPDGGLRAWLVVFGTVLISFSTFGIINAYGSFADFYQTEYLSKYPATLISMIGALQVFIMYIFAGVAGALFDARGPSLLIPLSGFGITLALFMLSITKPQQIWQQYLTQSILFAVSASFGFFPSVAVLAHWFKSKLAYAVGCMTAGASVGGILLPIMVRTLIPRIGFGWTVRIIAFTSLVFYIIGIFTIRGRRPLRPLPRPLSRLLAFEAFKNPVFAVYAVGCWFSIFSVFNPFFYLGLYANTTDPTSRLSPYYLAILCAGSIIGRAGPGFIANKLGRYNVLAVSTLLSNIFTLALWYTSTKEANLVAFSVLYGITSGPFYSLMPACIAVITPIDRIGATIGMNFVFMSTGALVGTPLGGLFIKEVTLENFRRLILFSGVMGLVGSLLICVARFMLKRDILAVI